MHTHAQPQAETPPPLVLARFAAFFPPELLNPPQPLLPPSLRQVMAKQQQTKGTSVFCYYYTIARSTFLCLYPSPHNPPPDNPTSNQTPQPQPPRPRRSAPPRPPRRSCTTAGTTAARPRRRPTTSCSPSSRGREAGVAKARERRERRERRWWCVAVFLVFVVVGLGGDRKSHRPLILHRLQHQHTTIDAHS